MSKPRSATLRVAHQRSCPNATRTSTESLEGCTCKPSYYCFHRDKAGRPVKGARVRDRQIADRALRKLQVDLDEDRADVGVQRRRNARTFNSWADEYLQNIERDKGNKGSTLRTYESTLSYARPVLGNLELDEIGQAELRQIVRAIRARGEAKEGEKPKPGGSDATVHKHLRQLSAILTAAVEEEVAQRNPLTRKFIRELRLRIPNRVESYTDIELAKLLAKMDALKYKPVYINVVRAALATGARIGELIALDWDDLNLSDRELRIRRHWDPIDGPTLPKDGEERIVYLHAQPDNPAKRRIPELLDGVALFEGWTAHSGVQPGTSPIFPAPGGGRLNGHYVAKIVDSARDAAGIPKVGEGGRERKPLHALRASYSRIAREANSPGWLRQSNLGHSTPGLTDGTYGTVSVAALRAAASGRDDVTSQ